MRVVKIQVLVDDVPEMHFAEDDEVIETLGFYRENPPLSVRIQIWRTRADFKYFEILGLQDGISRQKAPEYPKRR